VPNVKKIRGLNLPGTPWACPDLLRETFTFTFTSTIYSHTLSAYEYVLPFMEQFLTWSSRPPPLFCEILILYQPFEVFILLMKNRDFCFKILPWIRNITSATVRNFCMLITERSVRILVGGPQNIGQ